MLDRATTARSPRNINMLMWIIEMTSQFEMASGPPNSENLGPTQCRLHHRCKGSRISHEPMVIQVKQVIETIQMIQMSPVFQVIQVIQVN